MMLWTERLLIRDICNSDIAYLLELNNDYEVMRYISSNFNFTSASQENHGIKRQLAYYKENPGFGLWMIDLNDHAIGWVSLKYNPNLSAYELGYRLMSKYWRRGYASEACKKILAYAKSLNIDVIYAVAMKENNPSIGLMKKINMVYDREDFLYNEDVVVYRYDVF